MKNGKIALITDPYLNLLPFDGEVYYFGKILDEETSRSYFNILYRQVEWESDKVFIFGKEIITRRKVAWYGDQPYQYTYSNSTKSAIPWTKELLELKTLIENQSGERYNSCLLNLYDTGEVGMGWHSDAEKELKAHGAIASLSLGEARKFAFKHKVTGKSVSLPLEDGSLMVMKGITQSHWLHRLPPTKKVKGPRINLTFRTING